MIDLIEGISISELYRKDPLYFQRKVCRYYSEKFSTPLTEVYELPWVFVLTNYLEHLIENNNTQDQIHEIAVSTFYPERAQEEEDEIQDWIKRIEAEEQAKRDAKKAKEDAEENPHTEENPENEGEESIEMNSTSFEHLEKEMEDD